MNDIIEHYGKVVVALAGVLAAVLLTVAVVGIVNTKTTTAVETRHTRRGESCSIRSSTATARWSCTC